MGLMRLVYLIAGAAGVWLCGHGLVVESAPIAFAGLFLFWGGMMLALRGGA